MKFRLMLTAFAVLALLAAFWLGGMTAAPHEADSVPALGAMRSASAGTAGAATTATKTTAPAAAPISTARPIAASSAASSAATLPLPPLDAPLASIIDALRQRANAGDARAACRLAAELRKCELVDVQLAFAQHLEQQRQTSEQPDSAPGSGRGRGRRDDGQFADAQYRNALAASEHCKGVAQSSPTEQFRYWRQAALQGHIPSMTMYASGNAFRLRNSLSQLQDLEIYRHEAEAIARRAAFAGDTEALLALSMAYAPQHEQMQPSLLAQATGTNPVEELAMLLLAQQRGITQGRPRGRGPMFSWDAPSIDSAIAAVRERIDAEQALRAERLAAERNAQYPANNTSSYGATEPRSPFGFDAERQLCESESFAPVAPSPASG
jgi:hypothetical protein